jgi:hypothetical protein
MPTRTGVRALVQFLLDGQTTIRWTVTERRALDGLRRELDRGRLRRARNSPLLG